MHAKPSGPAAFDPAAGDLVNILGDLVVPSGIAYALFALGLLAAIWRRTRPASWPLLAASGCVTLLFSSGMVAAALMSPLEYGHPTLHDPQSAPQARHIVVLTGWATDDADMPLTGRMGSSAAYRVLLALELFEARPDCDVIVSGDLTTANIMGEALVKLGVPAQKLRLETGSRSTADSAAHLAPIVGRDGFFLVTSAGHLPRSIEAMRRHGLTAIAAPTDHKMSKDWRRAELGPAPGSLAVSDLAIHEYLGIVWYRLRAAG
jgi:uncharacterized SAM-binding protein YcdF (DUF218 family)